MKIILCVTIVLSLIISIDCSKQSGDQENNQSQRGIFHPKGGRFPWEMERFQRSQQFTWSYKKPSVSITV
jgi:hypothetical protein